MRHIIGIDDTAKVNSWLDCRAAEEYKSSLEGNIVYVITRNTDFGNAYFGIRTALRDKKHVYLIVADTIDSKSRQLCMLVLTYGCYNIYNVESVDSIDDEYIEVIEEREATIEEIGTFFGKDMETYPIVGDVLTEIVRLLRYDDVENIVKYISDNRDKIKSISGLLDYMKKVIDELSLMVYHSENKMDASAGDNSTLGKKIDELRSDLNKAEIENGVIKARNTELEGQIEYQASEINKLKGEIESTRATKSKAAIITDYITFNLDKFVSSNSINSRTPKIKEVLYFKEINPCRFINTFVVYLNMILCQIDMIDCRVLIYDESKFGNFKYNPLQVINNSQFMNNRDKIASANNTLVVVEPAVSILEDALVNNECLIIYDRLGGEHDLVSGRHVHKYYVANSLKDIKALESTGMEVTKSKIITNVGVSRECLSIREVKNFKQMTVNGKISAYLHMLNTGTDTRGLVDIIRNDNGLHRLSRATQKL